MTVTAPPNLCPQCRAADGLTDVTVRFGRCEACGFLAARPSSVTGEWPAHLGGAAAVAPDGVLRGKYRLIERLGEGAHGVSFLAEHVFLSHPCVVKVLPYRVGDASDAAVRRLRNEARAGFRVNDPNVVRVLDCDVARGAWYFVMEFVEGADLSVLLRQGLVMRWQQARAIALDAARGLAAIHRCGLIHRDVKPSNLILGTDGHVRVADLGVASLAHDHGDARGAGRAEAGGTLAYTAPETFLPDSPLDARADLYSLGATLYQLVTGRMPHHGNKVFQRLIDLQCRPVSWPADAPADVPSWFVDLTLQLLAIEPRERPASAEALLTHLQNPLEPLAIVTPPPAEQLEPRGLGVLPFENEGAAADDDWLGYALANHLARGLAAVPGVYVVDQDGLVALLNRLGAESAVLAGDRFLSGARMAGARTIVTGRYQRMGEAIRVRVDVLHTGNQAAQTVPWVDGTLAELDALERRLLDQLVGVLGVSATRRAGARITPARKLAAREKLVLGRQAFVHAEYARAIALGQEAVQLEPDFAEAIGLMGVSYARIGDYDAAAAQHRRQQELADQHHDFRLKIEALANLGVMNYFRGDYEAAEEHYERAADLAREYGLAVEEAQICNNLGFVLFRRGRPADAERAFLRAIETHRAYGGLTSLIGPYNGMGNVLVEQHRHAEARTYYRRALALAAEVGDRTSVGTTHMHLGRCAALEERFAEAKHEFTMALNALEETRFWNGLARAYEYIAEMNLQLGDYDEADRCADKRIELARQHANVRMESAAWQQKAEALRRAGRVEEATACLARERSRAADEPVKA